MDKYRRLLGYTARRRGFFVFILVLTVAAMAFSWYVSLPVRVREPRTCRTSRLPCVFGLKRRARPRRGTVARS